MQRYIFFWYGVNLLRIFFCLFCNPLRKHWISIRYKLLTNVNLFITSLFTLFYAVFNTFVHVQTMPWESQAKAHRSTKSNAFVAKTGCNGDVNEEIYVTLYSGCGREGSVCSLYNIYIIRYIKGKDDKYISFSE